MIPACGRKPSPAGYACTMRLLAFFVSLAILFGCSHRSPPTQPDDGQQRLVVLSPAVAVVLRDLGVGDRIVGRHNYDIVFPDLPACGQQGAIDYERLLAVHPTDILIQWGSQPLPERLQVLADRNSWRIHRYELVTLDDIEQAIAELQRLYAPDRPGEPLEASFERALRRRDGLERVGRVLLLGAVDPPTVLGPGSFHAQVLERIGATPAITSGGLWIELGLEDVLTIAPDAIVLVQPRPGGAGVQALGPDAVPLLGSLARLRLAAIDRGRVAVLDGELYHTPSTAMAPFAEDLARVLQGWAEQE
ncbi:MAG: hypothetical protein Kow0022_06040 [Phycisphaerales bacterium]